MNLLVFGGTQFVGRHIVDAARSKGHRVTIFHRGQTNQGLFPDVEELLGNRDGGLRVLDGRSWDAVIDVNGYVPRLVRDSVRALRDAAEQYTYISTLSVLADYSIPNQDETTPRAPFDHVTTIEEINKDTYGPLKAACEAVVESDWGASGLIVRPGYVVGPWDHTGRFPYWLRRVKRGGDMLVPGNPKAPIQFVDGRDLAAFVVRATEEKKTGIYHATGPAEEWSWERFLYEAKRVLQSDVRFVWVPETFLETQPMSPGDFPMWTPSTYDGLGRTDRRKAIAAGLSFRPVGDTVRDTFDWDEKHGRSDVGLTESKERELLQAWEKARQAVS